MCERERERAREGERKRERAREGERERESERRREGERERGREGERKRERGRAEGESRVRVFALPGPRMTMTMAGREGAMGPIGSITAPLLNAPNMNIISCVFMGTYT